MKEYFENKVTYNRISFHLTDKPTIDEREIHSYHEVLLYISGNVTLLTKKGGQVLQNHSLLIIPKETYHFFRRKASDSFVRLKISFPPHLSESLPLWDLLSEIRIFENLNDTVYHAFDRLYAILKTKTDRTGLYAYSAFLMLLTELAISGAEERTVCSSKNSGCMTELIEYISENLSDDLNIDTLAKKFYISASIITHVFKKEFGISIHKYITQKRLIQAKRLVQEGKPLSKIYADIGFMDYSSFYKAYVRFFGYPPSKEKRNS